ncbi:response regulator transcription factor [Pseudomonas knackmussii]|uniref:response regulator transcription factor n=1 Tax=Pseudomonas knackmussii TaxID=65741 RepID=UPI003F49B9D5
MNPNPSPPPRLLAIEDDPVLGAHLQSHLRQRGFAVDWCADGQQGLEQALLEPFDLILLDVMLPGCSGLDALRRLRSEQSVPVILMSALGAEQDRIAGFSQGADDYLPKPFSLAELNVRIDAILRRVALERGSQRQPLAVAELELCEEQCEVRLLGRSASLTASEYRLLELFLGSVDETLSKPFLYQHVLHRGYTAHDRSLDMHVSHLRRKLLALGYDRHQLRAVWGKGYVLASVD